MIEAEQYFIGRQVNCLLNPFGIESLAGDGEATLGAEYALSKRTGVYGLWTKVSNDSAGTTGIGGATGIATVTTSVKGADASGFSLGVNHSF